MARGDGLELAEEHVRIAQQLLNEESKFCEDREDCTPNKVRALIKGQFELEKAESNISDAVEETKSKTVNVKN